MLKFSVLFLFAAASAQIPSLGRCPYYQPMTNFNINRFLGTWYEAERFFTLSEIGSRCVTTKYESTPEGRILVNNEITMALTGMQRVMRGTVQMIGREGEGRMIIKYAPLPNSYSNEYTILDTDYENYAVILSCSGIRPVHIQNVWISTRDRLAPRMVMQKAYAVLDHHQISRAFFVKTNHANCNILPKPAANPLSVKTEAFIDAKNAPSSSSVEKMSLVKEDPIQKDPQERSVIAEISDETKPMKIAEIMLENIDDKIKIDKQDETKMEILEKSEMEKIPAKKTQ